MSYKYLNYLPELQNYFTECAKSIMEKYGNTCPLWFDKKEYDNIKDNDKNIQENKRQEYLLKRHYPKIIYNIGDNLILSKIKVVCIPNYYTSTRNCEHTIALEIEIQDKIVLAYGHPTILEIIEKKLDLNK